MSLANFFQHSSKQKDLVDSARVSIEDALSSVLAADEIPSIRDLGKFSDSVAPLWKIAGEKSLASFENNEFSISALFEINSLVSVDEYFENHSKITIGAPIAATVAYDINTDCHAAEDYISSLLACTDQLPTELTSVLLGESQPTVLDPYQGLDLLLYGQLCSDSSYGHLSSIWWNAQYTTYDFLGLQQAAYVTRLVYIYNLLNTKKKKSAYLADPPDTATAKPHKSNHFIPQTASNPPPYSSITSLDLLCDELLTGGFYEYSASTPSWGSTIDTY